MVLGRPSITRGTETREGVSGWITIKFPANNTAQDGYCGRATVAADGGWIELGYHVPSSAAGNCRVPGYVIAPSVIRHEIGHALGFYHTDSPSDLMWGGTWTNPYQEPSSRELYHAAIVYHREPYNTDPDDAPASATPLAVRHAPIVLH